MTAHWTLSQALAWIASKGSEEAVDASPPTVVELFLIEASAALDAAKVELWAALSDSRLIANGIGSNGMAALRTEIPAMLWQDLQPIAYPHHLRQQTEERLQRPGLNPGEAFTKVTVPSTTVMKLWPFTPSNTKRGPKMELRPSTPSNAKPGPKPKVNPELFIRVAHEWITENGMPDPKLDPQSRQADLERYMAEWHGDAIGESRNRALVANAIKTYKASN